MAYSLAITAGAGAAGSYCTVQTPNYLTGVAGGQVHTISGWWRAATTGRIVAFDVAWYNGTTFLSQSNDAVQGTDVVGTWTQITGTQLAPPAATQAVLIAKVFAPANGEVHNIDDISLTVGGDTLLNVGPSAALAVGDLVVAFALGTGISAVSAGAAPPNAHLAATSNAQGLVAGEDTLYWTGGAGTATFTWASGTNPVDGAILGFKAASLVNPSPATLNVAATFNTPTAGAAPAKTYGTGTYGAGTYGGTANIVVTPTVLNVTTAFSTPRFGVLVTLLNVATTLSAPRMLISPLGYNAAAAFTSPSHSSSVTLLLNVASTLPVPSLRASGTSNPLPLNVLTSFGASTSDVAIPITFGVVATLPRPGAGTMLVPTVLNVAAGLVTPVLFTQTHPTTLNVASTLLQPVTLTSNNLVVSLPASASLLAPTVVGLGTPGPSTYALSASLLTPVVQGIVPIVPTVLGVSASLLAPSVVGNAVVVPTTLNVAAAALTPSIQSSGATALTPTTMSWVSSPQTPITTGQAVAVVTPPTMSMAATVLSPMVGGQLNVSTTVPPFSVSAALFTPTVVGIASDVVSTFSVGSLLLTPIVGAYSLASPAPIALSATFLSLAAVQGQVSVTPDVLNVVGGLPTLGLSCSATPFMDVPAGFDSNSVAGAQPLPDGYGVVMTGLPPTTVGTVMTTAFGAFRTTLLMPTSVVALSANIQLTTVNLASAFPPVVPIAAVRFPQGVTWGASATLNMPQVGVTHSFAAVNFGTLAVGQKSTLAIVRYDGNGANFRQISVTDRVNWVVVGEWETGFGLADMETYAAPGYIHITFQPKSVGQFNAAIEAWDSFGSRQEIFVTGVGA